MSRWPQLAFLMALPLVLLALCLPVSAQAVKRLILKDGSYQIASQWKIEGDRVRYLSSERGEWEELPASLVDWNATENFNQERELQRSQDLRQAQREEDAEAALEASPTVAPGLQLPAPGGVYLLESYQGQSQLAELAQQSGDLNRRTGRNILRAAINPIASARQSIELKGEHAQVQSHSDQPAFYLSLDEPDPASKPLPLADRFRIARLEVKKDTRVVGTMKIGITGKVSQQESFVPAAVEKMAGGWVKLTPKQSLARGEYAIIEMLSARDMNIYVWDFGVDHSAPPNPEVLLPSPPKQPANAEASPGLEKRR
jgi:hypothetical protein